MEKLYRNRPGDKPRVERPVARSDSGRLRLVGAKRAALRLAPPGVREFEIFLYRLKRRRTAQRHSFREGRHG